MNEILNFSVSPGEYVSELLELRNMSQEELANRVGFSPKHISHVVNGKAAISPELALAFENVFGRSAKYWLGLQNAFDEFSYRSKINEELLLHSDWVILFDYLSLKSYGLVSAQRSIIEKGKELLRFFGVSDISAWKVTWLSPIEEIYCRSINAVQNTADLKTISRLASWIRIGQILVDKNLPDNYQDFNRQYLKASLSEIRDLTSIVDSDDLIQKLKNILKSSGVYLHLIPAQKSMKTHAATFLVRNNKIACIQLSLRGKTHDQFWFSLFHEFYHLLSKGKRQGFLIGESSDPQNEALADKFAADSLIDPIDYSNFLASNDFSEDSIKRFALQIRTHTGIVVGRLQHDKLIDFNELNKLKLKLFFD